MPLPPYNWDSPASGNRIIAGDAEPYSDPPQKSEIDNCFGMNQIIAAYRKEKSDHSLSYDEPDYIETGDSVTAQQFNELFVMRQLIQSARIGVTSESQRFPVAAGDFISHLHIRDLQFIGSDFDDIPPDYYQGSTGDDWGEWQPINGIRWSQSSPASWQAMLEADWVVRNYRSSADDPSLIRVARFVYHSSSPHQYERFCGTMRYGGVGNGYPGDPQLLDSITNAFVDIRFARLPVAPFPERDQRIAVLLGFNNLNNENILLSADSGEINGSRADRIYIASGNLALFSIDDSVRIYETGGMYPNYDGEQRTVIEKVSSDPDDPNYPSYLVLDSALSLTYRVNDGGRVWKTEEWDSFQAANVSVQGIIETNDDSGDVRVYLDPSKIRQAIINGWTLELFFVPLLFGDEPKDEDGERRFNSCVYPGSIIFEFTETGCGSSCEMQCEDSCEQFCEDGCEHYCEDGCEYYCEDGCEQFCEEACEQSQQE